MSPSRVGTLRRIAEGIAKAIDGRIGFENCLEKRVVERDTADAAGTDRRGSKKERIEDVECTAAILNGSRSDVETVAHAMHGSYMKL